jgi:predicted  nucleic acid-binding Zn-ribbon protein
MEGTHFSEVCETLVVNAHGCAIQTRVKLDAGVPLHLHSKDGREATARVVTCQPIDPDNRSWKLGAKLDRPENFWGLKECPKDWALPVVLVPPRNPQILKPTNAPASLHQMPGRGSQPLEVVADRAGQSESQVQKMIADAVRPLQAEIRSLKERQAQREANPSRFEVSLSSIPPEVENQIEQRLRKDLGPKVLDEARQQAASLLASAKATIDQRTAEGYENFLRGVAQELKVVEKRAEDISGHISANAREHLSRGLDDFHQKLVEGGNSLKRLSNELLEFLQQNLNAEHNARRGDLEQLRAAVKAESSRLQEQVEYLDTRIAKLNEAATSLESGMDQRLSRMSSDRVQETRSQLESVANEIFAELTARSAKALGNQLDEASGNMKTVQIGTVASVSEALKNHGADALQAFERSMEELARLSLERWRLKLEGGLNALARGLNEQFSLEGKDE